MLKKIFLFIFAIVIFFTCCTVVCGASIPQIPDENLLTPVDGAEEMLIHPGFEENAKWGSYTGADHFNTEQPRTGEHSAKLNPASGEASTYVSQPVTGKLVPGAVYQLSAWVYRPTDIGEFAFKLEFAGENGYDDTCRIATTAGSWHQVSMTFTVPYGTTKVTFRMRLYGDTTAVAYVDDVSLKMVEEAHRFQMETDQIYYYTNEDVENGSVKITANSEVYDDFSEWTADVSLADGSTVLFSKTNQSLASGNAVVDFPLSYFSNKEKEYTVKVTLKDSAGRTLEEGECSVYRKFARPSMIDSEGRFYVDGKEFMPIIGYHVYDKNDHYEQAKSMGVNVVQAAYNKIDDPESVIAELDKLQENGFMGLVCLYHDNDSGWCDTRIEATKALIPLIKNHSALFGYCLIDEPVGSNTPPEELAGAYEYIRSIDSVHPLYACDQNKNFAQTLSVYNDIIGFDCYPYGVYNTETHIAEVVQGADFYTKNTKKPVVTILQFFQRGENYPFFPTPYEMRNMLYQNFLAGGKGIGLYSISSTRVYDYDAGTDTEGVRNLDTPTADALRLWNTNEKAIVADHFVNGNGIVLGEEKTDNVWWRMWNVGEKVYVLALNRTESLQSCQIENNMFTTYAVMSIVGGGDETSIVNKADGILELSLPASGAVLYSLELGEIEIASDSNRYGSWRLYAENGKLYVEAKNFYTWKNYNCSIESDIIKDTMACIPVEGFEDNGRINHISDGSLGVKAYCRKTVTYQLREN
ncbi:MAG: carbohydrate binding domain-containing protein [Clostridia bacterium]|nr:carbohydrate binding domain-containing protein [Clostridia bacterium]